MNAGKYNFVAKQGTTFEPPLTWKPDGVLANLTGYSASMEIITSEEETLLLSLTTDNGKIVLGGTNGTIQPLISDQEMSALPRGLHLYDLYLTNAGGDVIPLLEGIFEVTRGRV